MWKHLESVDQNLLLINGHFPRKCSNLKTSLQSWHFEASEDIMAKFKSQFLHIIIIQYWNAGGSGNPAFLTPPSGSYSYAFYFINRPPWPNILTVSVITVNMGKSVIGRTDLKLLNLQFYYRIIQLDNGHFSGYVKPDFNNFFNSFMDVSIKLKSDLLKTIQI